MQPLAFGAKGILYFTYWTPTDPPIVWYPSIVDKTGVPTSQYDEVTRINTDVRTIGKYLLPAESVMVYDSGTPPAAGLNPAPPAAPVAFTYATAVTVGVFADATYTYALLANRDYREGTADAPVFRATIVMRLDKETGAWVDAAAGEDGSTKLTLGSGDAELYSLIPPRVLFKTTGGALEQLSLTFKSDGVGWSASEAGNAAIVGSITGSLAAYETTFGIGRTARIVYRDGGGRVRESFQILVSANWGRGDLTELAGAPPAAGDPFGYVSDFGPLGPQARVVYRGEDGHVHELWLSANPWQWAHGDLTELAGAPPAAGDPFGYVSDFGPLGPQARVVYRGEDGHVHELWLSANPWQWAHGDLTELAGAPPAAGDPFGYVSDFGPLGPQARVVYRGEDGHVHELWLSANPWQWAHGDLTELAGAPPAAGDPSVLTNAGA